MSLPGFLVEYLVNGSCALVWIWMIVLLAGSDAPALDKSSLALLAPALYVLGMIIDFIAKLFEELFKVHKKGARTTFHDFLRKKESDKYDYSKTAIIAAYSTDLSNHVGMRSSRDRVARGSIVNALLLTLCATLYVSQHPKPYFKWPLVLVAGLMLSGLCFLMWRHFEKLSSEFKNGAIVALNIKENKKLYRIID
jgi:hypothetical protein